MYNRLLSPRTDALYAIRREWNLTFGAITLDVVLSLWVGPIWTPAVSILFALLLAIGTNSRAHETARPCGRIAGMGIYSLLATGIISLAINVAHHTRTILQLFDADSLNASIPYITALIVYPACAVTAAIMSSRVQSARHARLCHLHNSINLNNPLFGRTIHSLYRSLLRRSAMITAAVSLVDWIYYATSYHNAALSGTDRYYFVILPTVVYVWALVYVRRTYSAASFIVGGATVTNIATGCSTSAYDGCTVLRYLIIRNDRLLLDVNPISISNCNVDTPLTIIQPDHIDPDNLIDKARKLAGLSQPCQIKLLYTSIDSVHRCEVQHLLVTVPDDTPDTQFEGQWVTLAEIDRMMKMDMVSPMLAAEIFRIYTITMAWKTYDRRGRRLYPIRNYRPTFRLADAHRWDVDYNDDHWLKVANINQDSHFYFLRRLFL